MEQNPPDGPGKYDFEKLCVLIKEAFFEDWENRESSGVTLEIQKRAIIGYEKEKDFFKNRINELIRGFESAGTVYPGWYENLTDAVYHENWGLAGLSEWFLDEWKNSSSAKMEPRANSAADSSTEVVSVAQSGMSPPSPRAVR